MQFIETLPLTPAAENLPMGSKIHSFIQAALSAVLINTGKFSVFTELSLDIQGKEYKPDICAYAPEKAVQDFLLDDIKVTEMPLLAVEILSPTQVSLVIAEKLAAYFNAGVKSCWVIVPIIKTVAVYSSLHDSKSYGEGELTDAGLNLKIPLQDIFSQTK